MSKLDTVCRGNSGRGLLVLCGMGNLINQTLRICCELDCESLETTVQRFSNSAPGPTAHHLLNLRTPWCGPATFERDLGGPLRPLVPLSTHTSLLSDIVWSMWCESLLASSKVCVLLPRSEWPSRLTDTCSRGNLKPKLSVLVGPSATRFARRSSPLPSQCLHGGSQLTHLQPYLRAMSVVGPRCLDSEEVEQQRP